MTWPFGKDRHLREIKFRAWNKKDQTMQSWDSLRGGQIKWLTNNDELIPEQFTGLHDENGKEIYEGDIISSISGDEPENMSGWLAEVIFEDGAFCIKMLDEKPETWPHDILSEYYDHVTCEGSKFEIDLKMS